MALYNQVAQKTTKNKTILKKIFFNYIYEGTKISMAAFSS